MEAFILISGLFLLFWFRNPIKKTSALLENTVNTLADTSDDSLQTYASDITISNAKKRSAQMDEISNIGSIVTNQEISDLLNKMNEDSNSNSEIKTKTNTGDN